MGQLIFTILKCNLQTLQFMIAIVQLNLNFKHVCGYIRTPEDLTQKFWHA